ncbi:SET domain-containing protein [Mycena venus]|uniref:carboxypeptidase C n=1 Tax=Mycena venus TaxID=2733690 RepID=A0A8H6XCK9_9AGAR|nr:SET domain-containing protein [Mycena venus]
MGRLQQRAAAKTLLPLLPPATKKSSRTSSALLTLAAIFLACLCAGFWFSASPSPSFTFYANITRPRGICRGVNGDASSYAGYVGIAGDAADSPRRSFFWFFEAEEDAPNAPIILTFGGGPGTTGMLRAFGSQGPCILTANGTVPNPDRITQRFNMLALDHPIGTGFSYGAIVNNSRDSALDVYDFLQKFFVLFPHLAKNQLIVSGGSYGGKFVPHIATVIQEKNALNAKAPTRSVGTVHINLESLIVSNPTSDPIAHYRWLLYYYCELHTVYDADTCASMYAKLPECLDLIAVSLQDTGFSDSANAARRAARGACSYIAWGGDTHGVMIEDVRKKCDNQDLACFPLFSWIERYMRDPTVLHALGIPSFVNYAALSDPVEEAFSATGDHMLPTHLMYEPLLANGIRVLHIIGAQDGNCAWPGVLSFLKLLNTSFQQDFLHAPDLPWPMSESDAATVRAVGAGAGNFTYVLIAGAGHFPQQDQPALVKDITERWISNRPWFSH